MEVIEGRNGSESPVEVGHDPKLHPLDGFGLEDEPGLEQLEVQQERHLGLLHFRRYRQTRH